MQILKAVCKHSAEVCSGCVSGLSRQRWVRSGASSACPFCSLCMNAQADKFRALKSTMPRLCYTSLGPRRGPWT